MAHAKQDRFSKLVDVKLRATLVTKDGVIFNNRYEGDPKAGAVKIPVRDTEVTVADYTANTGANITEGTTTYKTLTIDKDKAVNELIDGYAAAAVPEVPVIRWRLSWTRTVLPAWRQRQRTWNLPAMPP